MDLTVVSRLAIAFGLGLIIGFERGWKYRESSPGLDNAGIRTFALAGLLGGVAALLANQGGVWILAVVYLGISGLIATSYFLTAQKSGDYGTTTELSLFITFILGALVVRGYELEALASAVTTTWLLGFKQELHKFLTLLSKREVIAVLQLLLVGAVALPILPDQNLGPWQAINPRSICWIVFLIIGISFTGYFAIRIFGNRTGLLLTGFLGGLSSSTAVTIAFSRMMRQDQGAAPPLAAGITLAASVMVPRLLLVIGVVNADLVRELLSPLLILCVVPFISALIISRWKTQTDSVNKLELDNPIELRVALQYAGILTFISVAVRATEDWFGSTGVYILAAISGIADVDAVSISLARSVNSGMPSELAVTGILIAVFVNTLTKTIITRVIGGAILARWCGIILSSSLALSIGIWILLSS